MGKRNRNCEIVSNKLKGSYGQYLIENLTLIETIVNKTEIRRTDVILEIGSGTGNLTIELLKKATRVISIEFDPIMVMEIQRRLRNTPNVKKLTQIHGDILKISLPTFDVCVANLPYQLSSSVTLKLLAHRPAFRSAVMMYQTEFAMCLLAKPGDTSYGRLSVNAQLMSRVKFLLRVGAHNFRPRPNVESSVIRLTPKNPKPLINFLEWDGLIRLCFGRKNKTLGAIFRQHLTLLCLEQGSKIHYGQRAKNTRYEQLSRISESENKHASDDKKHGNVVFKKTLISVLVENGFEEMRSIKMCQQDFLRFLVVMNSKGVYFS
jgi:18S rRNA (adenine1779-N6/adenine1780-N6)-dimethyltransferase